MTPTPEAINAFNTALKALQEEHKFAIVAEAVLTTDGRIGTRLLAQSLSDTTKEVSEDETPVETLEANAGN